MDYVVFGIGFGATILVLGLLLRDIGPRLRFRTPRDGGDVLSAEELVGKVSWSRFCTALGSVLALAGAVFLLVTLVSMVLVVSDDTGLWVMASAFGALVVLMAYWTWAYFHRFGSYGILPERVEKPEPAPVAAPAPRPAPARAQVFAGPPAPAGVIEPAVERAEPVAAEADATPAAAEPEPATIASEHTEETTEPQPVAADEATEPVPAVTADTAAEARLETPEERLAHHETPIDHGSAEAELDLATTGPRRPGQRLPQRRAETAAETAPDEGTASQVVGPPAPQDPERA